MRRRDFVKLLVSAAAAWPLAGRAQHDYDRLIPFLIDLPDWTGPPPIGTEKEKGGQVITASRGYVRGGAVFYAHIISGDAKLASSDASVYITVKPTRKSTSTINGFQVTMESTPVFVLISITLGPNGMFNFLFNNVSDDEAMTIAQKFDWKGILSATSAS